MKQYWPCAETVHKSSLLLGNRLFTYDSCLRREDAERQFFLWANSGFRIAHAWIDVYEGDEKVEVIEWYGKQTTPKP